MNRSDFSILNNIIYFDNSATTLKPKCVIDKINDYYSSYPSNIHRGEYDISFKADEEYNNAREIVASFLNASSDEIVFTTQRTLNASPPKKSNNGNDEQDEENNEKN